MSDHEQENNSQADENAQGLQEQNHQQDLQQAPTTLETSQAQVNALSQMVNTLVETLSSNRNQREPIPRLSKDGDKVHPRYFRPSYFESCPTATHERVLWLENITLNLKLNQACIKWHDVNHSILCRADHEIIEVAPTMLTSSEIDTTVLYTAVFSSSKESCLVSAIDNCNTSCLVPIPTRI